MSREEFVARRALVTGASGFLGRRVVSRLAELGVSVRAMVKNPENAEGFIKGVEVFTASLSDYDSLKTACRDVDIVFHLAAAMGGSGSALVKTNVVGTRAIVQAAVELGVRRFVNISSLAVYDADYQADHDLIDESAPLEKEPERRDDYCYSKIMQERAAEETSGGSGIELITLRPGVIYGPGRPGIGSRIGLKYGPVLLKMGRRPILPYTFVSNCADAVAKIGLNGSPGTVYNIIDSDVPRAQDLIKAFRKTEGRLIVIPIMGMLVSPLTWFCEWYNRFSNGQLPAVMTKVDRVTLWSKTRYSNRRMQEVVGPTQAWTSEQALHQIS